MNTRLPMLLLTVMLVTSCAECDDVESDGNADAGAFIEIDVDPPDIYNPPDPEPGCGYGSGTSGGGSSGGTSGCDDPVQVDCAQSPCLRGACVPGEPDRCDCDAGFDGLLCNTCAVGFVPVGTDCVPCADAPCVNGTCAPQDEGPATCTCDEGYDGLLCDTCADGFMPEDDMCVPSRAEHLKSPTRHPQISQMTPRKEST